MKYSQVNSVASDGDDSTIGKFSIGDEDDDDDDEDVVVQFTEEAVRDGTDGKTISYGAFHDITSFLNTLTFYWMKPLLETGNVRALTMDDLLPLQHSDSAVGVYSKFKENWVSEKCVSSTTGKPSLAWTFLLSFGAPFFAAAVLKLVHDSCLFIGPQLLNKLIKFLNDPTMPLEVGLGYVAILFFTQCLMSLCLRQYFWWCYKVGMNLKSSVVTAVYSKSLVISAAALSRRTIGEISNLMSVDSSRLQDLTPYLHALWYSILQIALALYFLWGQLGVSCLAGMVIIILSIPITGKVSLYMKVLQTELSNVRDERIKLTNEVLNGMKVIKLQAWETEFEKRIDEVREAELRIFRRYTIAQSLSSALFTTIPLVVSLVNFTAYIALGNEMDVATALTSLALFDLLRFPLFMLPSVINNLVEAKVSVDRVERFLHEGERRPVTTYPLRSTGVLAHHATMVWEGAFQVYNSSLKIEEGSLLGWCRSVVVDAVEQVKLQLSQCSGGRIFRPAEPAISHSNSTVSVNSQQTSGSGSEQKERKNVRSATDEEFMSAVREAQVMEAEGRIRELEKELKRVRRERSTPTSKGMLIPPIDTSGDGGYGGLHGKDDSTMVYIDTDSPLLEGDGEDPYQSTEDDDAASDEFNMLLSNSSRDEDDRDGQLVVGDRLLTLSRLSLRARPGDLVSIVGQVGSGKSSVLSALLGNMRCCYGHLAARGKVAYAAQVPFIQNSTLRENIIFGSEYDEEKYMRTLFECALLPDIKVLPAGHETEIGERGINLSGGQKARVSLARAVYSDADIYLLDDPLSAVDAHVGQHLFTECILRLQQRGKCVLFVTNALQFLKSSTKILVLKEGYLSECGVYEDLLKAGRGFTDMITAMQDTGSGQSGGLTASTSTEALLEANLSELQAKRGEDVEGVDKDKTIAFTEESNGSSSSSSSEKSEKLEKKTSGELMTIEDSESGSVDSAVYYKWLVATGGAYVGMLFLCLFMVTEFVAVLSSWWLSFWSDHKGSPWFYLSIYALINLFVIMVTLTRDLYTRLKSLGAGRLLFTQLLDAILHAPMGFFDTTPLGRVINRFSKDIYTIDEKIPMTLRTYGSTLAKVCSTIIYVSIITPLFMIGLIPISGFYIMAQRYYIKTSRELTRVESTSRSPIYALFAETLDGLATIRAYSCERRLTKKNNLLLDNNQKAYFLNFSANCWLAVRLEFAGSLIVTFAALFAVLGRGNEDQSISNRDAYAGLAGLSISLALSVTQSLNWSVRMASDLESQMISVERVKSFSTMAQERPHYADTDPPTASSTSSFFSGSSVVHSALHSELWPSQGSIEFKNVMMRYRPGLPLVLRGLTLSISGRQKVGIVGRTGAGKSTIVTALLRLVELESGTISMDGMDISHMGLNTLRSAMAVIPQDPVLFSGTVRSNLDPFRQFTDIEVWESVRRTLLSDVIKDLEDVVTENGSNFSVGQRQLLCIARALLSKAKVIIMDEATAAVDVETDAAIQKTIREEFAHATCLTVAHRLNTILDSDKVLVMDNGVAAEFDTPQQLLADTSSLFYSLVNNWENAH